MSHQPEKSVIDNLQGVKPEISPAKAYAVCCKLKRMMKQDNVVNYESKYLELMKIAYCEFKNKVNHVLIFQLGFTKLEAKNWINEKL